jgi:hypothetical protein
MVSSAYLRRQASVCLRLAASSDSQKVAAALVAMAEEFSSRADEADPSLRSNGPATMDHCDHGRARC